MNETVEQEIYNRVKELFGMAPWEYIYETDIFGVKIPGNNKIYFVSVMGSAGQMSAMSAYDGYAALQMFWELQDENSGLQPWAIIDIPHLMISFPGKDCPDLDKMNLFLPEGINADGEFVPVIDKVIPGFVYSPPEGRDLDDLLIILEQSIDVLKRASEDKFLLMPEGFTNDDYLIRESKSGQAGYRWSDFYRNIPPRKIIYSGKYSKKLLTNLSNLSKTRDKFQLDLVMLPNPIMDKGPRGYFAYALLITNSRTGTVDGCELLTPFPNLHAMHESVPEHVLKMLDKMPVIPRVIEVKTSLMEVLLTSLLKKAGVEVSRVNMLESIDIAAKSLMSYLNREGN